MNELFYTLGIESWKPSVSMLLLPPLPFLVLVLVGARLMFRRRLLAWCLILLGVMGIWLSATTAVSGALTRGLLNPPRALTLDEINELRRAPRTAIVVLGAGRQLLAPEYGVSNLRPLSMERLRFGQWLARETSLPLGFSGGVGHGAAPGPTEAEIAARISEREFGRPLRWVEDNSRDTRENALRSVALLRAEGVEQIIVVTHGFHMKRALRNFQAAAEQAGTPMRIRAAPMGLEASGRLGAVDWLPTGEGFVRTRIVLHEWLGYLAGA